MEDPVNIVSPENEATVYVELINALFGSAQETHDITSLNIAIELVGELVVHDERNLRFLNHLLDIREYDLNLVTDLRSLKANLSLIILGGSPTSNTASPGDPISLNLRWSISSAQQWEMVEIIDNSFRQFCATGGINHWENAIGLAEVLALSNKKNEKPLNQLLDIRQVANPKLKSRGKANPEGEKTQETASADYSSGRSNQEAKPHIAPMTAFQVARLMETYYKKFVDTGEIKYLENAIPPAEMLMGSTRLTEMDPCYVNILLKVAGANHGGTFEQLGEEINWLEAALAETHTGCTNRMALLNNLCILYNTRYKRSGRVEDLEQVIKHSEAALAATPPENNDRARWLNNLGVSFHSRYDRFGEVEDIERAIRCSEEALVVKFSGGNRVEGFMNLSAFLLARYKRLGAVENLEKAIKHAELAASTENSDQVTQSSILIATFFERYERFGAVEDLEQAIKYAEAALAATPLEHNERAVWLSNLGSLLSSRYERTGAVEDLEKAIKCVEVALSAIPPRYNYRGHLLDNLGGKLFKRYMRSGVVEDFEQAIKHLEAALAATPPENNDRARRLKNLIAVLSERCARSGAVEDLEQAIKYSEVALAATSPEHIDRAAHLYSLSIQVYDRYKRFGAVEDLEQAIKHSEAALAATPPEHIDRARWLSSLAALLSERYERSGAAGDLEQAIRYSEAALAATPPKHNDRAQRLNNLSNSLCRRYKRFRAVEDLEQAIKHSEAALAANPPETAVYADMLGNLVTKLGVRYWRTNSLLEFYRIIHMLYLLWHSRTWPLLNRIRMAYIASKLFALKKMWQDSSSILADAVKLLPQVSSRGIGRKDQEYRLSGSLLTQIASTAVSVAFQAGEDASYCLRLFELGRGVIMGLVIDCRSDLSELQEKHPAMFEKFHSLRVEIDSPPAKINPNALLSIHGPTYEQVRDRRQLVADQLEEMLVSIRELPGFEGFQLPPHAHYLISMANDGPIVIFNSTHIRSDAIIVTSSGIKELRLGKLIFEEVKERMDEMRNLTSGPRSTYGDRNSRMLKMLQWLWDVAVEPVCEVLHLDPVADGTEFPRVWWIGTGPLSMAPFHAAGNPKSKNNTMSRAISSYIPTIKALSYARQKNLELLGKKDSRILLVTMPTTPGRQWSPLPGVVREAKNIADLAEGKAHTTQLEHPSAAQVLAELPSHDAIHFACHGKSDSKSPSGSALQLQPENESEEPDRLTVEAISNMKIQRAQIAYLSACCTAENASEKLADESIYIASGFQLAGFSHVLATQWVSMDRACLQVSGEFYRLLFDGQPCRSKGGHRKVSSSFHSAVKKLRDANWRQPIMWASFIHTGA